MSRGLEVLMYLAFSAAALPFAWLGASEILFYRAHPDQLETRDAAPLVLAMTPVVWIMVAALVLATILAVYFLVRGPRAVRYSSAILAAAWIVAFALGSLFTSSTPFASMARLYWDTVPFVVLSLLPWVCLAAQRGARARPMLDDRRTS